MPRQETPDVDPFDAAVPGQSLTQAPGEAAWERPPIHATPTEAINAIKLNLQQPDNYRDMLDLLYAGVTVESVTRVLTFSAFSEGLITPDVAEIANIYLFFYILGLARKAGIRPRLYNTNDAENINIPEIMGGLNPDRFNSILKTADNIQEAAPVGEAFMQMKDQATAEEMPTEEQPTAEEMPTEELEVLPEEEAEIPMKGEEI